MIINENDKLSLLYTVFILAIVYLFPVISAVLINIKNDLKIHKTGLKYVKIYV